MKQLLKRITIGFIALISFSLFTACFAFGEDISSDSGSTASSSSVEDQGSTEESSSSVPESSSSVPESISSVPESSSSTPESSSSVPESSSSAPESSSSAIEISSSSSNTTDTSDSNPPIDETPDDTPDACVEHDYVLTNVYNKEHHYLECSVCGERVSESHDFISFTVDATDAQTDYVAGESFNPDGLKVSIECECGRIQAIEDYEIVYPTAEQTQFVLGDSHVTVVYKEMQERIEIATHEFKGIKITTQPTDTTYEEGETFQEYGMVLSAYCDCGYERAVTGYKVFYPAAGQKNFRMGDTYVTITYGEWSIKLTVTVKKFGGGNWSGIVPF